MPKILLVEDNEMNRDMLSRRLVRNGFEVVVAVDGGQAVAMAASENPDLILMDMSLPVMDGLEATRQVKAGAVAGMYAVLFLPPLSAHVPLCCRALIASPAFRASSRESRSDQCGT
jgi:CheY-like chemotaxis protein